MMQQRRASVVAALAVITWAATATAERAWSQGVRDKTAIAWFTAGAYPSLTECRAALKDAAESLQAVVTNLLTLRRASLR